jgi:hypothetical protein
MVSSEILPARPWIQVADILFHLEFSAAVLCEQDLIIDLEFDLFIVSHGNDQTCLWLFLRGFREQKTGCGFTLLVQGLDEHVSAHRL